MAPLSCAVHLPHLVVRRPPAEELDLFVVDHAPVAPPFAPWRDDDTPVDCVCALGHLVGVVAIRVSTSNDLQRIVHCDHACQFFVFIEDGIVFQFDER